MRLRRKIALSLGGLFCFLLAFLAAAVILAPAYLNSPKIKAKIETAVSRELGGTVQYERLDLSVFPRPHVTFRETRLSLPKTAKGTLKLLSIYPQLVPLVQGRLFVSLIQVREPDLKIALPETVTEVKPESLSLPEVKKNVLLVLGYLRLIGPGLVLEMDQGSLVLRRKGRPYLSLHNASVRFNAPPGIMDVTVKAVTEPWGNFLLKGKYFFDDEKAEVKDLSLKMGRSWISDFSSSLEWKEAPRLEITSGRASFALDEMYQWLSSAGTLTAYVKDVKSLSGSLVLSSIQAGVPLYRPSASRIRITGEADRAAADWALLPVPLSMDGRFIVEENKLSVADFSAHLGKSSLAHVSASLRNRKKPFITVLDGNAVLDLAELFSWRAKYGPLDRRLKDLKALSGVLRLSSLKLKGPLFEPTAWQANISGQVRGVVVDSMRVPGPITASQGDFNLTADKLSFDNLQASVLDTRLTGSGALSGNREGMDALDLSLAGTAGRDSIQWAFTRFTLPQKLLVNSPLAFRNSHLLWQKTEGVTFTGNVIVADGPSLSLDLSRTAATIKAGRATIKDGDTNATITARQNGKTTDFSFSGKLSQPTLSRIFEQGGFGKGNVQGDFKASVNADRPLDSTAQGRLTGDDIVVPWGGAVPLMVDNFTLHAGKNILTVDSSVLTWGDHHYAMYGNVTASASGLVLDLDLGADRIVVSEIQNALAGTATGGTAAGPSRMPPVIGVVRVRSSSLLFGRYTFSPAQAVVTLSPHRVSMAFTNARTCDISVLGTLAFSGKDIDFDFKPAAAKQPLESTLDCLTGKDVHITGTFDLTANVRAKGKGGALLPSLEGAVDFTSKDGTIYRYPVLAKIFSVLSVLEIFRGRLPELGGNGFPYHAMAVKGRIHEGKFVLEKAYIGGKSIDIIAEGDVDLAARKMDLVVIVAPFSTINWIIRHIPLVNSIMGGTLISVPVKVSGDVANPDVTFLAPSAVGRRLLDLLENILELPVKLISPILPKEKEKQE